MCSGQTGPTFHIHTGVRTYYWRAPVWPDHVLWGTWHWYCSPCWSDFSFFWPSRHFPLDLLWLCCQGASPYPHSQAFTTYLHIGQSGFFPVQLAHNNHLSRILFHSVCLSKRFAYVHHFLKSIRCGAHEGQVISWTSSAVVMRTNAASNSTLFQLLQQLGHVYGEEYRWDDTALPDAVHDVEGVWDTAVPYSSHPWVFITVKEALQYHWRQPPLYQQQKQHVMLHPVKGLTGIYEWCVYSASLPPVVSHHLFYNQCAHCSSMGVFKCILHITRR